MADPMSEIDIRNIISPILINTYGRSSMTTALAKYLANLTSEFNGEDRERMILNTCWNWFPGGTTAENVAKRIEEALS